MHETILPPDLVGPRKLPAPSLPPGLLLPRRLGRYTLFDHVGRGGMADIYLAQADTGLGGARLVVIKEVLPDLAHQSEFADMLIAEAKLAARLDHANVAKVEDLGRHAGSLYIAMEYVEGLDLREMLRRCARGKVALPVEFSLRIVTEALRALSFAHRARDEEGRRLGIVHRDVSPSNVLLSFEGEVKLCDFGIARAAPLAGGIDDETIAGKAGYMSPEQARGEVLDARSDVFAAGIILWEMLAGRRLYRAAEGEKLLDVARRAEVPYLPMRGLPHEEELFAIVGRALEPNRDERYASAAAMLADLEEYAARAGLVASPIRFGEWLTAHFGGDVLGTRRARHTVMRALARGPAAVIQPIVEEPSRLPDYEMTPSAFPVALRVGAEDDARDRPAITPTAPMVAADRPSPRPEAPKAPLVHDRGSVRRAGLRPDTPAPRRQAIRLEALGLMMLLAASMLAAMWLVTAR